MDLKCSSSVEDAPSENGNPECSVSVYQDECKPDLSSSAVLSPWPDITNGIPSASFLDACETILECIGAFGTLLYPAKVDVEGNINKLRKTYSQNPTDYEFIEHMVISENKADKSNAVSSLLWLKRTLHFVYIMLDSLIQNTDRGECDEDISGNYLHAYENSLKKHHNIFLQKVFIVCINRNVLPGRRRALLALPSSKAAGLDESTPTHEIVEKIKPMMKGFKENLSAVFKLYHSLGLDEPLVL